MLQYCAVRIMTKVHPIPPVTVYLPPRPPSPSLDTILTEKWTACYQSSCRFCDRHRTLLIVLVLCLCVGSVTVSVLIKNNNIKPNPCYGYKSDTLASEVSLDCVHYLWNLAQCSTALESSPTWKWWIQSPQGTTMVRCDATHTGTQCGAGSYQTVSLYLSTCNPYFGQ